MKIRWNLIFDSCLIEEPLEEETYQFSGNIENIDSDLDSLLKDLDTTAQKVFSEVIEFFEVDKLTY